MDEKIITDFAQKLDIFLESFSGISNMFLEKLDGLNANTCQIVENTEFLKKLRTRLDEEQKRLQNMETVTEGLLDRLDRIRGHK